MVRFVTLSETVKTNVSFHSGSLPAPVFRIGVTILGKENMKC